MAKVVGAYYIPAECRYCARYRKACGRPHLVETTIRATLTGML
jgi:hypothetical protein